MKRILTAALALSLLGGSAALAQPYDGRHNDHGGYGQRMDNRQDNRGHHWNRGERLPTSYYRSRNTYVDYRRHHLRAPPRGYQWVQVDNNYALVALTTGLISQLIASR